MHIAIQFSSREELKALPILLRHSPGRILPDRRYVTTEGAAQALREAGVEFRRVQLSGEADAPWKAFPRATKDTSNDG
jgi:hypothetical protein